jgi:hypothetical protein
VVRACGPLRARELPLLGRRTTRPALQLGLVTEPVPPAGTAAIELARVNSRAGGHGDP